MKKELNKKEAYRRLRLQLAMPGPVVVLATLLFWSLGGGGSEVHADGAAKPGLNVQVPPPAREGRPVDKLALYKMAQMDSMRMMQKEGGARLPAGAFPGEDSSEVGRGGDEPSGGRVDERQGRWRGDVRSGGPSGAERRESAGPGRWAGDSNERRVMAQLADLKARLHGSPGLGLGLTPMGQRGDEGVMNANGVGMIDRRDGAALVRQSGGISPMNSGTSRSPEVERLERLVTTLRESGSTESPEMRDLNRTLDRLITAEESLRSGRGVVGPSKGAGSRTDSGAALRVAPLGREEAVTGMQAAEPVRNRFYDLESNNGEEEPTGTAMEAIVPETQTLVNGATIRLELATELVIRGQRVGKGSALYGTVRLSNERLLVTVSSIRCGSEVFPVAMRVLDQDGLPGIYSPGSITRDATRESAGEAVGELGPAGLETTTSGQALNAGIQLARNLARRKVQLARVTVKAGYRVFLQDESKGH